MVKKEQLFALIKSLTKAEKRYFKLFASINNAEANYILLFNAIDEQEVYNEKLIKEKFRNKKFVKQLHVSKNYLNKLILKSLRNYHSKISKDSELKEMIREIEILFRRDLFEQCRDVITKAERTAMEYENLTALLDILSWKKKVLLTRGGPFESRKKINEIIELEKDSIKNMDLNNRYWNYTINIFEHFEKKKKERESVLRDPLLNNENLAETLQNKILFYHLQYSAAIAKNENEKALNALSSLIKLIENHPDRIKDDPHSYITSLNNKIGMLLNMKKYKSIPGLLSKVREVPKKYKLKDESKITFKLLLRTYNVELEMYRDTENIEKGIELIGEVKEFVKNNDESISPVYKGMLFYQFAYIHFMNNDYGESLKWINKIINYEFGRGREDIESYARFLNLIIHYELKNVYILRYAVEATRRFLKKKRNLKDFEKVLLKFFSRLSTQHPEKHKDLFACLEDELFSKTSAREKADVLDYLNFEKWISNKK